MLIDIARPFAFVFCVLSLCALFYSLFLTPAANVGEVTWTAVTLLSLAAGISLISGILFLDPEEHGPGALARTLPVQLFLRAIALMILLFVIAWYMESDGIFYRDMRRL
jgi:hypothetical protein